MRGPSTHRATPKEPGKEIDETLCRPKTGNSGRAATEKTFCEDENEVELGPVLLD
jgi:hypothetical protein